MAPWLNDDLQKFYLSLLRSEARHYQDYLDLAQQIAEEDISERIHQLGEAEAALINARRPNSVSTAACRWSRRKEPFPEAVRSASGLPNRRVT